MGIESELEPTLWTIEEAAQRERVDMLAARIRAKDYDGPAAPVPRKAVPLKRGIQGFASMSAERVKAISALGGKAAHARGVAHEWKADEAAEAGRKGGHATARVNLAARSNRADARCGLCRREGHYADVCPKRKKKRTRYEPSTSSRGITGFDEFGSAVRKARRRALDVAGPVVPSDGVVGGLKIYGYV